VPNVGGSRFGGVLERVKPVGDRGVRAVDERPVVAFDWPGYFRQP